MQSRIQPRYATHPYGRLPTASAHHDSQSCSRPSLIQQLLEAAETSETRQPTQPSEVEEPATTEPERSESIKEEVQLLLATAPWKRHRIYTYAIKRDISNLELGAEINAIPLKSVESKRHSRHCGLNINILEHTAAHPALSEVLRDIRLHLSRGALCLGIYCNHGKHRSVSLAHLLSGVLNARVTHLDQQAWPCSTCGECDLDRHVARRKAAAEQFKLVWDSL